MSEQEVVKVRTNQFGDTVTGSNHMTPDIWKEKWSKGQTKFHKTHVHPLLERNYLRAFENQPSKARCFVPLCGKSVDIKWLADKGHTVIGNEVSEVGCRQFFQENDIPYDHVPLKDKPGSIYQSRDNTVDVSLFCCDYFQLTKDLIGGCVDFIWDRGSLVAVNFEQRAQYRDVITDLMKPTASYLLCAVLLDNSIFAGPPTSLPKEDIEHLFGSKCTVTMLEERDAMTEWQRSWGLSALTEQVHLISFRDLN